LELLVEQTCVVDDDAFEPPVELLGIDPMRAILNSSDRCCKLPDNSTPDVGTESSSAPNRP